MLKVFVILVFFAGVKNEILLLPQLYNGTEVIVIKTDCRLQNDDFCSHECSKTNITKIFGDGLINNFIRNGTNTFVVKNDEQYGVDDGFQINKKLLIPSDGTLYRVTLPKKFNTPTLITTNVSLNKECDYTQTNLNLTDLNYYKTEDVQILPNRSSKLLEHPNIKFPEKDMLAENNSKISTRQFTRNGKPNLPPLIIETNINSQLRINPGQNPKIIFDVMSNMDKAVYVTFSCRDERGVLRDLVPRWSWIMPGQVIQVTVLTTLGGSNPSNTMTNFADTITLIALGNGVSKTEKSALVQVSGFKNQDTTRPYLTYQYTTTCATVRSSICESEIWTVEIRAQDKESGILQVGSNPVGIYFPTSYTSGTKELITGHYSASCCEPYLEIYAIDVNNNRRTYKLDANYLYMSDAAIAAVVLGVVLLIILIVVIVLFIRKKYYEKDSLDLPTYRGNRT